MLLFGLVPFDYDDLTLVEVWPGRGFLERSSMLSMRVWEHERTIEVAAEGGCVVRDRLSFEPGLPVPLGFVVRALFRHRHRRLRRLFVDAAG